MTLDVELEALSRFSRVPLVEGPTPIQRLKRLEDVLGCEAAGVRLFAKRDDATNVGGGGNKLRKLEFLLGEALAQGCDTFITSGGIQSNHARLSAAAAARLGLACELVLAPFAPREDRDYCGNGNVLLDQLFGATIHYVGQDVDPLGFAESRAERLRAAGRSPYVVGLGGSSPTGCLGYVACAAEISAQERAMATRFSEIVVTNGSSGTHAGLLAGLAALGSGPERILSFTVLAPSPDARQRTHALACETAELIGAGAIAPDAVRVNGEALGDGYGVPTAAMVEAVELMARTEGLLLDPVYTGKAFAGLLARVRSGVYRHGDAVLFVMTGGSPGLFAYRQEFES